MEPSATPPLRVAESIDVAPNPLAPLDDPRALHVLTAEHSSLSQARSLAYTEAFTRGGMFLGFLSMSFVALALIAQALPIDRDFLLIVAVVLAFDLVIGATSYGRIIRANYEDYLAVHGMARIRHGYAEIAAAIRPYIVSSMHDDLTGVMVSYGSPPTTGLGVVVYQLTTAAGMISLIVSMIGGILALVVTVIAGGSGAVAFIVAVVAALAAFLALAVVTVRFYIGVQARIEVLFPTPPVDDRRGWDSAS